jgi:hypothetical protein
MPAGEVAFVEVPVVVIRVRFSGSRHPPRGAGDAVSAGGSGSARHAAKPGSRKQLPGSNSREANPMPPGPAQAFWISA